tara:strand:- start:649 stop:1020 length:372 start_codon:yes stop_codon:yes gene_type:complete
MSHQIFKDDIPNNILYELLSEICTTKNDKYFVVDKIAFKKAQFNKILQPFLDSLDKYYHESKKFYLKRKLNYTKFVTIIRQICKKNEIPFSNTIKYDKSTYNIIYYIYLVNDNNSDNTNNITN